MVAFGTRTFFLWAPTIPLAVTINDAATLLENWNFMFWEAGPFIDPPSLFTRCTPIEQLEAKHDANNLSIGAPPCRWRDAPLGGNRTGSDGGEIDFGAIYRIWRNSLRYLYAGLLFTIGGITSAVPFVGAYAQSKQPVEASPIFSDLGRRAASSDSTQAVVVTAPFDTVVADGLINPTTADKSVSTVSSVYIRSQAPMQNAYQYVRLTPGAMVSTADPLGLSAQGSINIHGLGQDEIGYVLEGMPLNDVGFYTAYPSQFIDSENIDKIALAQNSSDLDSPVISAAGGLMAIKMIDPALVSGGRAGASYGSYNSDREFLRLDSGPIGDSGWRAFASYSHTRLRRLAWPLGSHSATRRLQGSEGMGRRPHRARRNMARRRYAQLHHSNAGRLSTKWNSRELRLQIQSGRCKLLSVIFRRIPIILYKCTLRIPFNG